MKTLIAPSVGRFVAIPLCLALATISELRAANYVWNLTANGSWSNPDSWDLASGVPDGADDTATISVTGGLFTVTLDGDYVVGGLNLTSGDATFAATSRGFTVEGATEYSGGGLFLNSSNYITNGAFNHHSGPLDLLNSSISGGGVYAQDGGTLTLSNGTVGVPATNTGGEILVTSTGTFNAGLDNAGEVTVQNGAALTINNAGFSSSGTVEILAGANTTALRTTTGQTFTNEPSGVLTVEAGTAAARQLTINLDNQGTVDLNSPTLLNLVGGVHTNSGTITAPANFALQGAESFLNSTALTSTGGFLTLAGNNSATSIFQNTGTLTVANGFSLSRFEEMHNSGLIDITGGTGTVTMGSFDNPQFFTNSGDIEVAPGASLTLNTGYNLTTARATFDPGSTMDGGGNLTFTSIGLTIDGAWSPNTSPWTVASSVLGGAGSIAIISSGSLSSSASSYDLPLTNDGTIEFNGTQTVSGGLTNNAVLNLSNGSALTINSHDITNRSTLDLLGGSGTTTLTSNAQVLRNASAGTVTVHPATGLRSFRTDIENEGHFDIDAATRFDRSNGIYSNLGTIDAAEQLTLANAERFSNANLLTSTGGHFSFDGSNSATSSFENSGTLTALSGLVLSQFETVSNTGRIDLSGGNATITMGGFNNPQTFTNAGDIEVAPGSMFTLQTGHSQPTAVINFGSGSTLDGGGDLVLTTVTLTLDGPYSPNTSPLSITGSSLGGAGSLLIPATSRLTSSGTTYGVPVTIDGPANLSGNHTLNAAFVNNDTFTLANNTTLTLNNADFTNNGLMELTGGASSTAISSGTQTLVNAPTGTIVVDAATGPRSFTLDLDNQGQIDLEAATRFNRAAGTYLNAGTITAAQALTLSNVGSFTNSHQLTSTGGSFNFDGDNSPASVFDNSGTLTIANGLGLSQFENVLNSGTISLTGGNATVTLGGFNNPQSLTNSGGMAVSPGSTFTLQTGYTAGTALVSFDDGATWDGGGNLVLSTVTLDLGGSWSPQTSPLSVVSSVIGGSSGSLDIPATSTLTSSGSTFGIPITSAAAANFSGSNTLAGGFTNNDVFSLADNSTLTVNNADFANNGTLELAGGPSRSIITSSNRTLVNGPASTIAVQAGAGERYFTLSLDNQGQFEIDAPVRFNRSGGTYTNTGTIDSSAQVRVEGASFDNSGPFTTSGRFIFSNVERFSNDGQLTSTGGDFSFDGNSSATSLFDNSGTMTVANGLVLTQFENANNTGTIDVTGGNVTVTIGQFNNPQVFTNAGDIEIAPGSTLAFQTGYNLSATRVVFDPGSSLDGGGAINLSSVALTLGGVYSPMDSPLSFVSSTVGGASGSLEIPATGQLSSAATSFGVPITADGQVDFSGNNTLNGGFTNEDTFTLANNGTLTINNEDFLNTGLLELAGGVNTSTVTSGTRTLRNAPTGTITVEPATGLRRLTLAVENEGVMNLNAPTRFDRGGAVYTNSGTILAAEQLRLSEAERFTNTNLLTSTGGNFSFDGNSSATSLLDNAGTLTIANGMTLTQFERVINSGTISLIGGDATVTIGQFNNTQSFTNSGDVEVSPGSAFTFQTGYTVPTAAVTFDAGSSFDGGGNLNLNSVTLTLGGAYSPNSSPLNLTSSTVNGSGTLTIANGSPLVVVGGSLSAPVINHGTATLGSTIINSGFENGGEGLLIQPNNTTLTINNADLVNRGTFEIEGGNNRSTLTSGTQTLVNDPTGLITILPGTQERRFDLNFENQGELVVDSNLRFNRSGISLVNSGIITASALFRTQNAEAVANTGTISSSATGSLSFAGTATGTSSWDNAGDLVIGNGMGISGFENVMNSGLIDLVSGDASVTLGAFNNPQQFSNAGEIRIAGGSTFTLSTSWAATASNEIGGMISGDGIFDRGTISFTNHGILAPGLSTGVLTFGQDLANTATAEFEIQIASADGPGDGHDQLVVNGNLALTGTLRPELLDGFTPTPSDSFIIMRTVGGELTGTFDSVEQPYAPFGLFEVTIDEALDQVILTFTGTGPLSFADYQELYFTPQEIANGDADPAADVDRDGLSTMVEWVHGFDPTSSFRTVSALELLRDESGLLTLTFPRSLLLLEGSVEISLLSSPDGEAAFTTVPLADYEELPTVAIPGNIELVTLRVSNSVWTADPFRFFRLQFTMTDP